MKLRLPRIKKVSTIPQETLDKAKKIDSTYEFQDVEKEGETTKETLEEKPVIRQDEENKKINLHPKEPIIEPIKENEVKKELIEKPVLPDTEENKILTPDKQGIMRISDKSITSSENTQQIIFRDASSVIAEKLPEQLGTDPIDLKRGKYDVRRLTNITPLDRVWISYFDLLDPLEGGDWAKGYANEYMNLSMSIGGERARLLVKMQMAAGGGNTSFKKPEDKRNFIERHFTKRGQEPKEDDINEL